MTQTMTVIMRMLHKFQVLSDFSTLEEQSNYDYKLHLWTFVDTLLIF